MPFLLYFGCWDEPGHFLWDRNRMTIHDPFQQFGPNVIQPEYLDGSRLFLPTPEIPGKGRLTRIVRNDEAITVLAWWDRTFDKRPGCCAAIQCDGWENLDYLWVRFSHVYERLAAKLTKPDIN